MGADKGFPGVLTSVSSGASAAGGSMSTAQVMSSGGFWFAVVAEVLGALAVVSVAVSMCRLTGQ